MKEDSQMHRNDILTLAVLVVITTLSVLFPYATFSYGFGGAFPDPPPSSIPVYLLSVLADDTILRDCPTIASAVVSYGIVFVFLTQATAVLHASVNSARLHLTTGLVLMLIVSTIWVFVCDLAYGHLLSWRLVQLPFIPYVGTVSMLFYRETVGSNGPGVSME